MLDTSKNGYMWLNYRIKLHNLTEEQKLRIKHVSDVRRFLYNWALAICNASYEEVGKIPPYQEIARQFTRYKKLPGNEWLDSINVASCRYAFKDLSDAFHNFFKGNCKHPKFRKKKEDSIRFAVRSSDVSFKGSDKRYAFIPVLSSKKGDLIDCGNHNIPRGKDIKYENTRIKFDGVDYWLSLSIKSIIPMDFPKSDQEISDIVGIDVGVRTSATLSNGIVYNGINHHRENMLDHRRRVLQSAVDKDVHRRLKESQRTITKYDDIPKSKNQLKRERKLAKTRIQIHNLYSNYYHNISKQIANSGYDAVVLETLETSKSVRNAFGKARNKIYEARMYMLSTYIEYKCRQMDIKIIHAPMDYPSSQICSSCGSRYKIGKQKTYKCPFCGLIIDRDLNAAYNLRDYGMSIIAQ